MSKSLSFLFFYFPKQLPFLLAFIGKFYKICSKVLLIAKIFSQQNILLTHFLPKCDKNAPKTYKIKQTICLIFLPLIISLSLSHSFSLTFIISFSSHFLRTIDLLDLMKWIYSKIIYQVFLRLKMH